MKALGKLFRELVAWRWAPAVGLCVASLFYVVLVVALVPNEIGVPVTNARFAQKLTPTPTPTETPEAPTYPTAVPEQEAAPSPPPPAAVQPAGVVDFGRRGFSPPIDRPEAPLPPPMPPTVNIVPATPENPAPPPEAPPVEAPAPAAAPDAVPGAPPPVAATPPAAPPGILRSMQAFRGRGMFPVFPPGSGGAPGTMPPGQVPPGPVPPGQVPPGQQPPTQ